MKILWFIQNLILLILLSKNILNSNNMLFYISGNSKKVSVIKPIILKQEPSVNNIKI